MTIRPFPAPFLARLAARALLALMALAAPLALGARQPPPDLKVLAERFDAAQAKVETLQAPFTLTITRSMLRTPTVTKGTLYLQGSDFAHFAFAPPEDLILHLTPKLLVSYSPGTREGEQLKIGFLRNHNRKFLGLGQKMAYLSDYFTLSLDAGNGGPANTWQLKLVPRTLSMKRRFQSLTLWVDRDSYLPRQVLWVEKSGDAWLLELGALQLNRPLPSAVTGFKVPPGVTLRDEFSFFATRRK